jgi:hypothetical protein
MDLQGDTTSQKMEITARFTFNSEVEDGVGVQTIPIKYLQSCYERSTYAYDTSKDFSEKITMGNGVLSTN